MTSVSELDVYEIAYLCGGAERVALAAVVAMREDGRVTISRTRHREARAELEGSGVQVPREQRVAVLGARGIAEPGLRDIFETPDPPPGPRLLSKTRKTAGPYNDLPPDTHLPMQPGISGRW